MDKREASAVLVQAKWLRDRIKEWEAEAKAVLLGELQPGDSLSAITPHGPLGKAGVANGKRAMHIDNEDGFLAWVQMRYPSEVVQAVRPAFISKLQEQALENGALIDAKGEVCPHVSVGTGNPYPYTTLDKKADAVIRHMLRQRSLDAVMDQPELVAPPGEDAAEVVPLEFDVEPEVYDGPLDDTTRGYVVDESRQDASTDPEPDLSDSQVGPPNWAESNTFESSDNVRRKRGNQE